MIERQALEAQRGVRSTELFVVTCRRQARQVRSWTHVRHDDHARDRRQAFEDARDALDRIERLAAVAVAVRRKQHFRRDLPEAVEHATNAEVGGA